MLTKDKEREIISLLANCVKLLVPILIKLKDIGGVFHRYCRVISWILTDKLTNFSTSLENSYFKTLLFL